MFAKFSIRAKITALVAALLIAMSGMGGLGMLKIRTMNVATLDIATNWLPTIRVLGELQVRCPQLSHRRPQSSAERHGRGQGRRG